MPFLMVQITSSNSIDKWVIFGKKVDFSQYSILQRALKDFI